MSSSDFVQILQADLDRPDHQQDVLALTVAYAMDPMGNAGPLPADVLDRLIPGLRSHPTTVILLAYVAGSCVGIATCFLGFSTFLARPLLNIHDLAVLPEYRGRGIGQTLLGAVEQKARELGCGRVTLEVHESNTTARRAYLRAGFVHAIYGETVGGALFLTKVL